MPCSDGGFSNEQVYSIRERNEGLAKGLCVLCEKFSTLGTLPPTIAAWYEAHKQADKRRYDVERARVALAIFKSQCASQGLILAGNHPRIQEMQELDRELCLAETQERDATMSLRGLRA